MSGGDRPRGAVPPHRTGYLLILTDRSALRLRHSLVATVEPVVAAFLALLLGERLDGPQVVGGLLVLSAVLVAGRPPRAGAG